MIWNFTKNLAKSGASAASNAISRTWQRRLIRKRLEEFFAEVPSHQDPFLLADVLSVDDYSMESLANLSGIELLESCLGAFEQVSRESQYAVGNLTEVRATNLTFREAVFGLGRIDITEITDIDEVQDNYNFWVNEMKEECLKALDAQLDCAANIEAEKLQIEDHLDAFAEHLSEAHLDELIGTNQGQIVSLYRAMSDAFGRHELVELRRLAAVPEDVNRINQIETVIDLYMLKMRRVNEDTTLSEHERDVKLASWQSLMEADIQALGAAS